MYLETKQQPCQRVQRGNTRCSGSNATHGLHSNQSVAWPTGERAHWLLTTNYQDLRLTYTHQVSRLSNPSGEVKCRLVLNQPTLSCSVIGATGVG